MKKIAAIALVLSMAMMTACGGSGNTANDQASSGNGEETKDVYKRQGDEYWSAGPDRQGKSNSKILYG